MNKAVDYFWTWFIDNHMKLKTLRTLKPKDQKHYTFWLDWHLHFYAKGIDYLLVFPKRSKDKAQLIITANGNPQYFEKVEEIINTAPRMNDWTITAFIKPKYEYDELESGLDKPYVLQDITLKTSELKCTPLKYEGEKKIDMIVYLRNYTVYSQNTNLIELIFIMVRDLLGEKSLYQNINFVELAQLPAHENAEVIQLYELQFYLDYINESIKY